MKSIARRASSGRSDLFLAYPRNSWTLALIHGMRWNLQRTLPLVDDSAWHEYLLWLVTRGCADYPFLSADTELVDYLQGSEPGDCLSRLQRLVYTHCEEARVEYALPADQDAFEQWFLAHAVPRYRLWPLLGDAAGRACTGLGVAQDRTGAVRTHREDRSASRPFGVNLIGHAFGQLGIGEDVRMAAHALAAAHVPFTVIDFPPGRDTPQEDRSIEDLVGRHGPYAVNLFCMTAAEQGRYFLQKGPGQFSGCYNIGFWPWELSKWPAAWQGVTRLVDEVWVSSRHTYDALAPVCPVHVQRMPMAVEVKEISDKGRPQFGLPESAVLFCFAFDLNSFVQRKNPQACIEAFLKAFPAQGPGQDPADVGLVIKLHGPAWRLPEWEEAGKAAGEDERIFVIEETLDRADLLALYRSCDCFVSLHRAEGFGRCIAEAMQLGLHVITTGYSGNLDFCTRPGVDLVDYSLVAVGDGNYPFAAGQVWAEPDIDHAAVLMRRFVDERRGPQGAASRRTTGPRREFSAERVGWHYRQRLQEILGNQP